MVVFLLALVGVLLIVLNLYLINKDSNKNKNKDLFKENLSSSIENVDVNIIEIGKIRIEIVESFLDL